MFYKLLLLTAVLTLFGCNNSDKKDNLPAIVEINLPHSPISLQTISLSASIKDPENQNTTQTWQLSSTNGVEVSANSETLEFIIPFTTIDTLYSVTLIVIDSEGNKTTTSESFSVPAVSVEFSIPFGAISQRYIDVEANISNIQIDKINSDWEIISENEYPLKKITPSRIRFLAEKPLSEEYSPNPTKPEYNRGEAISEEVTVNFTISYNNDETTFTDVLTIEPIQAISYWPLHEVLTSENSPKNTLSKLSTKNKIKNNTARFNETEVANCLNRISSHKQYFDYNQDEIDDVFCSKEHSSSWQDTAYLKKDTVYFYLSERQQNGDIKYSESIIKTASSILGSVLIDFNNDLVPELVLEDKLDNNNSSVIALLFNQQNKQFTQETIFEFNQEIISHGFVATDNKLFMIKETPLDGNLELITFDYNSLPLQPINLLELPKLVNTGRATEGIETFISSNIDEQGKDELLMKISYTSSYFDKALYSLYIVSAPYTSYESYSSQHYFSNIYQENIDDDDYLEWIGIEDEFLNNGITPKAAFKRHLSLNNNGGPISSILDNYFADIFFEFRANSFSIDINQDGQLDLLTHYTPYNEFDPSAHLYLTYSLQNKKQILLTPLKAEYHNYSIDIKDMDKDGDLDIALITYSSENKQKVVAWLENINGYPFN